MKLPPGLLSRDWSQASTTSAASSSRYLVKYSFASVIVDLVSARKRESLEDAVSFSLTDSTDL